MDRITDKKKATHYLWGNNCDSWVLADTPGLSVKQEQMPPGKKERLHLHRQATQVFYILRGTAAFYCGDRKTLLVPQQAMLVLPGEHHCIANEHDSDLEFLVISQPGTSADRVEVG